MIGKKCLMRKKGRLCLSMMQWQGISLREIFFRGPIPAKRKKGNGYPCQPITFVDVFFWVAREAMPFILRTWV